MIPTALAVVPGAAMGLLAVLMAMSVRSRAGEILAICLAGVAPVVTLGIWMLLRAYDAGAF